MVYFTGRRESTGIRARRAVPHIPPRMLVLVLPLLLGACGLPPALQIASWITNGISYLTTDKSISDHGISLVSGRDCAVHRSLAGNDICNIGEEGESMIASLDNATDSPLAPGAAESRDEPAAAPAAMDLAAGPLDAARAEPEPAAALAAMDLAAGPLNTASVEPEFDGGVPPNAEPPAAPETPHHGEEPAATGQKMADRQIADMGKSGGVYYSLASFSVLANAEKLIRLNGALSPALMTAQVNGRNVYRVVVGPVTKSEGKSLRKEIASAGFRGAWALWAAPREIKG